MGKTNTPTANQETTGAGVETNTPTANQETTGAGVETNTPTAKREKIFIPMAVGREDPTLEVMINGKRYRLPKGTEQEVPAEVAAEIRRSWAAARAFEQTRRQKLDEAAKAANAIN